MVIRNAKFDDIHQISELEKHISLEKLCKKISAKEIIIVEENEELIGYLRFNFFWDEIPFMNMLFLKSEYRKQGWGRELVLFWEKEMKQQEYSSLLVSTMSNESSQYFYRKLNYVDIGGFVLPQEPLELMLFKEI
ncbi:MAG: hypothetical protein B6226_04450 [Candidatus Cloacimonetes bacterium 4572_65]|nr:MAG: hypothetical protein B6226_04450 [Candidatus Cloacimonetes bacterium 4572_65]